MESKKEVHCCVWLKQNEVSLTIFNAVCLEFNLNQNFMASSFCKARKLLIRFCLGSLFTVHFKNTIYAKSRKPNGIIALITNCKSTLTRSLNRDWVPLLKLEVIYFDLFSIDIIYVYYAYLNLIGILLSLILLWQKSNFFILKVSFWITYITHI